MDADIDATVTLTEAQQRAPTSGLPRAWMPSPARSCRSRSAATT